VKYPQKKNRYTNTLLVDGDSLLKTAYHGAKDLYHKEVHIGGIFQFLTMLRKIINEYRFDKVYVFWDGKYSGRLRYDVYSDYKSNRNKDFYNDTPPTDIELYYQKERVKLYCEELFIRQYSDEVIEGDDCIAYYVKNIKPDEKIVIMSNDRDLCQLIDVRVGIYIINLKKIVSTLNYHEYFNHHQKNLKLIKIISGDVSDCIKGITGISEKTLINHIPEIKEKSITLDFILTRIEEIQQERKTRLKSLDNILNRVTKGIQKEKIFEINEKIIDLSKPMLTESSKNDMDYLFETTIDPEGREIKNVINMMIEDGLINAIPGGNDNYINYLQPFLNVIKREKKYYNDLNS
jgi:5'-3' exonuclease